MVALETPKAMVGWQAPAFELQATDGREYTLDSLKGAKGTLIVFICNHCPYVQKQVERMCDLARQLEAIGVKMIAINANDAERYPDDSFDNMQAYAAQNDFPFPYLYDETQAVARAYGAVCTPDFFGFNADLTLQYRGRLDSSWSGVLENPRQELLAAMREVALTGQTSLPQNPSIGCSIKWKMDSAAQAS